MGLANIGILIKAKYDRLLAGVFSVALLVALGFVSVRFLARPTAWEELRGTIGALRPRHPDVERVDAAPYESAERQAAAPEMPAGWTNAIFVPESRYWCEDCHWPIPMSSTICPFCGKPQPPSSDVTALRDTDKDGIPDGWETDHGMDPANPDDAEEDGDGDGFTALEEYRFEPRTDPRDVKSAPPISLKLHVVQARMRPFRLMFRGMNKLPNGDIVFQVNEIGPEGQRSHFKKLGEDVSGYTLEKFDYQTERKETVSSLRDVSVLTVRKGDVQVPLTLGRTFGEARAILRFDVTKEDIDVKKDDTLILLGQKYQVIGVDIKAETVVIQPEFDGAVLTVGRGEAR